MNKHKMSKKLLATIMTFAMLITMFPSGVFAAPGDSGQENTPAVGEIRNNPQSADGENGNIVVNKSVTPGENGTYNLTLEAYATNKVDTIKTTTPLDIVLVLDTSGSMDEKFGSGKKAPKKIEALRTAANSFIDSVDKQNQDIKNSDDKHRISIVKFADENIKDGIGNDFTNDHYNYTQQVIGFSDEAQSLKDAVNSLSPAGSTAADSGLEKTQSVLDDARENAKKIVIFFTDGDPNHGVVFEGFEFQRNVATKAINTAGSLKASGATIYTIGIFNGANPSDLNGDSNEYMNAVSSNYPQAIASYEDTWGGGKYNVTLGTRAPQNEDYYFAASDANGLNQVFQNISETITNETLKANPDATAVLTDTLSEYFTFPEGWTGDVTDKATVQFVKAKGIDSDGNIQWEQPEDADGVTVTVEGKTISITGFDYKANAVTEKDGGGYDGGKLVVTFKIKADESKITGDDWYDTNNIDKQKANLFYRGENADENNKHIYLKDSPEVYLGIPKDNGTDVTIQVYVDGEQVDPDTVVELSRVHDGKWTEFSRVKKDGNVLTYDFNYNPDDGNDCVDIKVDPADGYILQGVHSYQNYGKPDGSGTKNVTDNKDGTYTVDNVTGVREEDENVDCTIYLRTAYSAEYYVDGDLQTGADWTDDTNYVAGKLDTDVAETSSEKPAQGASKWMDWKNSDYATSITLKELPTVSGSVVDGWYLGDDTNKAQSPVSVAENVGKAENHVFKFNATTAKLYNITINYVDDDNHQLQDAKTINDLKNGTEKTFDVSTEEGADIPKIIEKDGKQYVFNRLTEGNWTVEINGADAEITAEYLLDSDKDGTPDEYEATVTYKVENGTWSDEGGSDPIKEEFVIKEFDPDKNSWVNKEATLGDTIPEATANAGYDQNTGAWNEDIDENTKVTKDVTYIYTFDNQKYAVTIQYQNEDGDTIKDFFKDDPEIVNTDYAYTVSDDENGDIPFIIKDGDTQYIYDRLADNSAALSGKLDGNKTITAIYAVDANDNDVPDKYDATVTYKIVNGTWNGEDRADKTAIFPMKEFTDGAWADITPAPTLDDSVPSLDAAKADDGFDQNSGSWDTTPTAETEVKDDAVYTYTFAAKDYQLIYNANGGNADSVPVDDNKYALNAEVALNTETVPTHADADGSAVVFLGWSAEPVNKIIGEGEQYTDKLITEVTFNEESIKDGNITVYAVWGYDTNGDKTADAEQVMIKPADITIYTGGNGYESVVIGSDNEFAETDNGLPTPGFYITLPYDLNQEVLSKAEDAGDATEVTNADGTTTKVADLSKYLTFNYDDTKATREWTIERYDAGNTSMAYNKYIYRINPYDPDPNVEGDEIPIRLLFSNGTEAVNSDDFVVTTDVMYREYSMTIYAGDLEQDLVKASIKDDEQKYDAGVGSGLLKIRGVTDEETTEVTPVNGDLSTADNVTVQASEGTKFYINSSKLEVADGNQVGLLVDSTISEETDAKMQDLAVTNFKEIDETHNVDLKYLDLVDYTNGNTWVTASEPVTVFWPFPEDADTSKDFYIVHYTGLDRDENGALTDRYDPENMTLYSANSTDEATKLTRTEDGRGLTFTVESFSPFAIYYTEEDNGGSGWIPGGSGDDDTPTLNTEDHFSYIVGYPEDYRTGEATDDESLWPVKPQGKITRAEVATIFYRLLTNDARTEYWTKTNDFNDVSEDNWFNTPVSTLSNMGIIVGYEDGSFRPNAPITRGEFAAIAVRFFQNNDVEYVPGTFTDIEGSEWFADAIAAAYEHGIIGGYVDGSFQPLNQITRAEAAAIVNRTTKRVPDKDHLLPEDEMRVWPDNANPDAWYYADIQEATNSHEFHRIDDPDGEEGDQIEQWTARGVDADWDAVEDYQESVH